MTRRHLLWAMGLALLAHGPLLSDRFFALQVAAALLLTGLLPGLILVEVWVGRSTAPPSVVEHLLYAVAAGFGVMVTGMLLVSYLPGPLLGWQVLLAFDLLLAALLAWAWFGKPVQGRALLFDDLTPPTDRRWLWVGLLSLLLVAALLRLTNLGYAEFQGDEARAALRAAAVIQGYEDVLLIHKKGPTEILAPTAIFALTGQLTEAAARLPFALANLAGLLAVYLLGWRLFGPLVGWSAAMLLALDGYLIGFSRIVQYQSMVFLTSALVVLVLYRLLRRPRALTAYLSLAAFLLALGLLSHYEALQVAVPAAFLLATLGWRRLVRWADLLRALVAPVLIGGVLLALFYVPFVLHPQFSATYTYLADRRVGGSFPYNNLADFALRTTVYTTSYQFMLMVVLTVVALFLAYRQGLGRTWGAVLGVAVALLVASTSLDADWLLVGGTDYVAVPFTAAVLLVWFMPKISAEERMLWLWFGAAMLLALFFTEKPRTHVYIFFTPWSLLVGYTILRGWQALARRTGGRTLTAGGLAVAGILIAVFGFYAYMYFVHNQVEVLRTWPTNRPAGYWTAYDEPDQKAIFGFPLANGWKVVGDLYNQGVLTGDYETSEKEAWVPAWYTRGQQRCSTSAAWYFQIENLEPWGSDDQQAMEDLLGRDFAKWAKVEVNGGPKMVIYQRTGEPAAAPALQPIDGLPAYILEDHIPAFDRMTSPAFHLTYPAVNPQIQNPLRVNFDNQLWLEGFDIDHPQLLRPGDTIRLTLYWRGQRPMNQSYKVFNQSYYGNGTMVAQRDGYPVCGNRETWRWDPGELITDEYDLTVMPDAPDGLYPLYTGMYIEETGDRLAVLDADGNRVDSQVHLTDIRIGTE